MGTIRRAYATNEERDAARRSQQYARNAKLRTRLGTDAEYRVTYETRRALSTVNRAARLTQSNVVRDELLHARAHLEAALAAGRI